MSSIRIESRDKRIDILKAIGIICVVAGHSGSKLTPWFYTFHLPLFFIVTGYLRYGRKESWKGFIKKKTKTTILPYVVFWTISVLYSYLYWYVMFKSSPGHLTIDDFVGLILGGDWLYKHTNNFSIWYLQFLFIAVIVFEIIVKYFKPVLKILLFILLIFVTAPIQQLFNGRAIFDINVLPAALLFMLLGYFLKYMQSKGKLDKVKDNIPIGILALVGGWGFSVRHYGNVGQIGSYSYILGAILIVFGLYILSSLLVNNKALLYIGKNTLYILGMHSLVKEVCFNITNYILKRADLNFLSLNMIISVSLMIALSCGLAEIHYLGTETLKKIKKMKVKIEIVD